ncbi:MAG: preprotein translocase subunit SecG [Candidatus Marinimicrobia bacterium]|nr:preprotein translocase subunit SecG [Candidatus Neomarinimicrobiota bacterium]|tara:strand:- start:660 stop:896 length:237 start_codon:yes stop_codon:yes gene_type:complete
MGTLGYMCLAIFVLVCIMLIGIILLQSSKSGMGAGIGGNTALNSAFGSAEADKLLVKITTGLAVLYMALAILMSFLVK